MWTAPPYEFTPQLLIEVADATDVGIVVPIKLLEYSSVGVRQCWIAYTLERKIEQWKLSAGSEPKKLWTYLDGETLISSSFPHLEINVTNALNF